MLLVKDLAPAALLVAGLALSGVPSARASSGGGAVTHPNPAGPEASGAGLEGSPALSPCDADTLEVESGHVRADGLRLFYRALGSGEPVIVLHGGPSPGHGYLLPWMDRLADDYRLVLFDQRGVGRSEADPDSASLTRAVLVEDVTRVREALGIEEPFHLIGHSWGGLLALEYALRHPGALRSLVLVSTTEPGGRYGDALRSALEERESPSDSVELAGLFASPGFRRGDPSVIERIYRLTYRPWLGRPEVASALSFRIDGKTARKGRRTARLVVANSPAPEHWGELSSLEVPALVVHGTRDPVPLEMARELADSLPLSSLEVLPGIGHFAFAEAPARFFPAVRGFLDAPSRVSSSGTGPDPSRVDSARAAPLSTSFVEVEGRRLRVRCGGSGDPGVLFLHGARDRLEAWREVLPEVSGFARACAYDRPGHGESEPLGGDRSPADLVEEIEAVAREVGIEAPFVLVGHSLGGLYARLYAASRPSKVGALVLVDPAHEDMHRRLREAVPENFWREWGENRRRNDDGVDEREIAEVLREGPLPDIPVRVITAGLRRGEREGFDPVALDRVSRELHARIVEGSSRGRHVVVAGAGHAVQLDRPGVVVRVMREAIASAGR